VVMTDEKLIYDEPMNRGFLSIRIGGESKYWRFDGMLTEGGRISNKNRRIKKQIMKWIKHHGMNVQTDTTNRWDWWYTPA